LAVGYGNLAALLLHVGDSARLQTEKANHSDPPQYDEALRAIQSSLQIRRTPPLAGDIRPEMRYALAGDLMNYGGMLRRLEHYGEAFDVFSQAIATTKDLLRDSPHHIDYTVLLVQAYVNQAQLRFTQGEDEAAATDYEQALAVLDAEAAHAPGERRLLELYGIASYERAESLYALGRFREAAMEFQRTLKYIADEERMTVQSRMIVANIRAGVDVATEAKHLAATGAADPFILFDVAQAYAVAARDVLQDESSSGGKRDELIGGYAAKAVELLQQAHRKGVMQRAELVEKLKHADEFATLREREEFLEALRQLSSP
jgi:tetratricopeptide (TPR) repeat protein